ncbi:MAG: hypothetical protein ABJ277_12930 [Flavobacteriaceae bacterium]
MEGELLGAFRTGGTERGKIVRLVGKKAGDFKDVEVNQEVSKLKK